MLNFTYRTDEFQTRWSAVKREIKSTGTYELTHEELEYGVQLCWRNEPRCSARIQWKNLVSLMITLSISIDSFSICNRFYKIQYISYIIAKFLEIAGQARCYYYSWNVPSYDRAC